MLLVVLEKVNAALGTINCTLFLERPGSGDTDSGLMESVRVGDLGQAPLRRHPHLALAQAVFNHNCPAYFVERLEANREG